MSLGKDLASIRKELGLSLEEIQSSIKIPMLTLKSIENDSIFQSTEHNQTYIRSFVRSYARGLHLNDEDIVQALDAVEAGIYDHDLLKTDSNKTDSTEKSAPEDYEPFDLKKVPLPDIEVAQQEAKPTVENVNWADLGKKFSLQDSSSKNWVLLLIIIFVLSLLATGFFFREEIIGFFGSDSSENVEPVENNFPTLPDNTQEDDSTTSENLPIPENNSEETTNEVVSPPQSTITGSLPDILTVSVYAAYDKLEPVRVTSDLNWRVNPFWMEQGEAFNFDFDDSLLVRGQYSRMLLLFNGHVIQDHRQYYDSELESVLITRSVLDSPSYLAPSTGEYPDGVNPPDSLVYRINY
jgi:cytoskeletal protein RodZ